MSCAGNGGLGTRLSCPATPPKEESTPRGHSLYQGHLQNLFFFFQKRCWLVFMDNSW